MLLALGDEHLQVVVIGPQALGQLGHEGSAHRVGDVVQPGQHMGHATPVLPHSEDDPGHPLDDGQRWLMALLAHGVSVAPGRGAGFP